MQKRTRSKSSEKTGIIYLVSTPIGNLDDISYRAVLILKDVDIVAAEDTRSVRKIFQHIGLRDKIVRSYHNANEERETPLLIEAVRQGKSIAVVSEAGTPGISDPGFLLVREAWKFNIRVVPIPGPSAIHAALICSGFPSNAYIYLGFLPIKKGPRRRLFEDLRNEQRTCVCFESVHRIQKALIDLADILPDREICLARELTKEFETFYKGIPMDVLALLVENDEIRGEFTLVIKGA